MRSNSENSTLKLLELRNYLLKPNTLNKFASYFSNHFVEKMAELGGDTLGQFQVIGEPDKFVWLRGFPDMKTRSRFLRDFYSDSQTWKEFGPGANEMMINSDNVHLLRPLSEKVCMDFLADDSRFVTIDFCRCSSSLEAVIALFQASIQPHLETLSIATTLWVSEMGENDFPRLPVFQDKDLLCAITSYRSIAEYERKLMQLEEMDAALKTRMQELITTQHRLMLLPISDTMPEQQKTEPRIPKLVFDSSGHIVVKASTHSSKHDFDFLHGMHTVHHRKLKERLAGCDEWIEFDGTHRQEPFLNGMGNIEQQKMIDIHGNPVEGAAIRLFDPESRLWSIYWADSSTGKFDPPVRGSFSNHVGYFFTKDSFKGEDIVIVFCWDASDTLNPVWSQAFSKDRGDTWEWNWHMYFSS